MASSPPTGPRDIAYLDHAATTPLRPVALGAMLPCLTEVFGNPSGSHTVARQARRVIDEARDVVAGAVGCEPKAVVFTSGGTEADNTAIAGAIAHRGGVPVCSAVEHHAVLHVVERLGGRVVGVHADGTIDLDALADALGPDVGVVSVMAVNNEVGTVQPISQAVAIVRDQAPQALFHTDAVQAASWLDLEALTREVDLLALSAHKFGGPKGVGVLVHGPGADIAPLLEGGGQELDRRSGTHNVAGIAGLAAALHETVTGRSGEVTRIERMRDRLVDGLVAEIPDLVETVPRARKVAGSAHVCVPGVESEALLFLLDRAGVCASAASACASGAMEPSHVLAAMGLSRHLTQGALRISFGWASTDADVDRALQAVPDAVRVLRA